LIVDRDAKLMLARGCPLCQVSPKIGIPGREVMV